MRHVLNSLVLVCIVGSTPNASAASPEAILEDAVQRCETWMKNSDDEVLMSGWTLSHINIVPNTEGGMGEITREVHHPNFNIIIQISLRPSSGNRACSVITGVTAFNNLEEMGLPNITPISAKQLINSWMVEAKTRAEYRSIPKEGWFDSSILHCSSEENFTVGSMTASSSVSDYIPWIMSFGKDHSTEGKCGS